jgi:hypothetical protein
MTDASKRRCHDSELTTPCDPYCALVWAVKVELTVDQLEVLDRGNVGATVEIQT